MKFLKKLSENIDCLSLFGTKIMQVQIDYLWSICRRFFVYRIFIPFLLLGVLPLSIMAFMVSNIKDYDHESNVLSFALFYLSVLAFGINTIVNASIEVTEIRAVKLKKYLKLDNVFQLITIVVNIVLIIQILTCTGTFVSVDIDHEVDEKLDIVRINMGVCIMLNMLELFARVKIFDFFALFVR